MAISINPNKLAFALRRVGQKASLRHGKGDGTAALAPLHSVDERHRRPFQSKCSGIDWHSQQPQSLPDYQMSGWYVASLLDISRSKHHRAFSGNVVSSRKNTRGA